MWSLYGKVAADMFAAHIVTSPYLLVEVKHILFLIQYNSSVCVKVHILEGNDEFARTMMLWLNTLFPQRLNLRTLALRQLTWLFHKPCIVWHLYSFLLQTPFYLRHTCNVRTIGQLMMKCSQCHCPDILSVITVK